MPAGNYDKRAAIQSRGTTEDAGGNVAELTDESGRELYRAQQVDPTIDAVIKFRTEYTALTPEHRIVIDGRNFDIKSILGRSSRDVGGQVVGCTEVI